MGLLAKVGIKKGESFKPSPELEAIHAKAAPEALEYMIEEYHRVPPKAPKGKENNWVQTIPGKGWNTIFRLYGPLESWFDQTWRPGEIELVNYARSE